MGATGLEPVTSTMST